jgi:hypothetical protein
VCLCVMVRNLPRCIAASCGWKKALACMCAHAMYTRRFENNVDTETKTVTNLSFLDRIGNVLCIVTRTPHLPQVHTSIVEKEAGAMSHPLTC